MAFRAVVRPYSARARLDELQHRSGQADDDNCHPLHRASVEGGARWGRAANARRGPCPIAVQHKRAALAGVSRHIVSRRMVGEFAGA
jgi:hypothetical protein